VFHVKHVTVALVGTGTDVGKTHLGEALLIAAALRQIQAVGLKPIESGSGPATDASRLEQVSTFHVKQSAPYRFQTPVSPHLAARLEADEIALPRVLSWIASHSDSPLSIIETAGALLSPLSRTLTNLSLVRALAPTALVLVARDRLGVLHDVTVTLHALRTLAPELPTPAVVLQPPAIPDASTGTNARELSLLDVAPSAFALPFAPPGDATVQAAVAPLFNLILRS